MRTIFIPKVGDIVFCYMPESESVLQLGPKLRPVIILDIAQSENELEVLIAYGTSQHTQRCGLGEFVVTEHKTNSLKKTTKFCLNKRMWLPFNSNFFTNNSIIEQVPQSCYESFYMACLEAGLIH